MRPHFLTPAWWSRWVHLPVELVRGRPLRDPRSWLIIGLGLYLAGYCLWLLSGPADSALTRLIGNLVYIPLGLVVMLLAWRAGRREGARRQTTWAWSLIALAYLADALGNMTWLTLESILGVEPFPSWADAAYLLYYPLLLAGLLCFPATPRLHQSPTFWLDAGVVFLGGGMAVWLLVLAPIARSAAATWVEATLALAYPVGSLVVLFGIAAVLLDPQPDPLRRPPPLLLLTLTISAVADLAYAALTLDGVYHSGHWLDGLWAIEYSLVALSIALANAPGPLASPVAHTVAALRSRLHVLPYLGAATGYGVLLALAVTAQRVSLLTALGVSAIGAMSIARHVVAQRQNTRLLAERAAQAVEERYRALVQHADDIMLILDAEGVVQYSSPATSRTLGLAPAALAGLPLLGLIAPDDAPAAEAAFAQILTNSGQPITLELRLRHTDGCWRTCVLTGRNLLHDAAIGGVVVVCRDITQAAVAAAALRASESLNRSVLNALPAQLAVLDRTGRIMAVNDAWMAAAQAGGDPDGAQTGIGVNYLEVCRRGADEDYDAAVVLRGLQAVLRGEQDLFTHEYPCMTPGGLHWYLLYATPLQGGQQGVVIAHLDISDRKHLEQERESLIAQLHDLAHTDGLTGLANRRAFTDGAERAWHQARRSGQSLGLILLDIDHFKQINDSYGHLVGDQVLRVVAARCRAAVRGMDLVGRYGGEEFAILSPGISQAGAAEMAERLRATVAGAPVQVEGHALAVTVSVGVMVGQMPAPPLAALLASADAALYVAKRGGRNRVAYGW